MGEVFQLDHGPLSRDHRHAVLADGLGTQTRIDSRASFNDYCRRACHLWEESFGATEIPPRFTELLARIARGGREIIPTAWGGVVITLHEHPRVEKYLVVRRGGYLALEKHAQKDEHLEVQEGAGLILSRRSPDEPLSVRALAPGDSFHFAPGMEHCLIGTDNLLVFERGTDPKGMDQDLIFIYEPDPLQLVRSLLSP